MTLIIKILCIEFDFTKPLCKMGTGWQMRPNELCSYNHVGAPWMTQILCIEFDLTKPIFNKSKSLISREREFWIFLTIIFNLLFVKMTEY